MRRLLRTLPPRAAVRRLSNKSAPPRRAAVVRRLSDGKSLEDLVRNKTAAAVAARPVAGNAKRRATGAALRAAARAPARPAARSATGRAAARTARVLGRAARAADRGRFAFSCLASCAG